MTSNQQLLREIEEFVVRVGLSETSFGTLAVSDPSLIAKLRRGRSVTLDMADRLRAFMRDYRPPVQKKAITENVAA